MNLNDAQHLQPAQETRTDAAWLTPRQSVKVKAAITSPYRVLRWSEISRSGAVVILRSLGSGRRGVQAEGEVTDAASWSMNGSSRTTNASPVADAAATRPSTPSSVRRKVARW